MLRAVFGKMNGLSGGRVRLAALAVLAVASIAAGAVLASRSADARHRAPLDVSRPNIVFVLTDDLAFNLVQFMPHVQAMLREGMSFNNYFVTDSLCCPSRASIFTGQFPHNTGIFNNGGRDGGFGLFYRRGETLQTFNLALQRQGYLTAMMGKYLNGYLQQAAAPDTYVPPGWSEWDVAGNGYPEFDYVLNQNGSLFAYGHQPSDYLTDVIAAKGTDFIDRAAASKRPFFLELATFAPHLPSTPAPRDASLFPDLTAPRLPSFDALPADPPLWLAGHDPLTPGQVARIDDEFRRRAQSVQAVDEMIAAIRERLAADGIANNTYLVFSSDNGYHMGEYRLMPGKLTAFDTDIRVPLVVIGPGVPAGSSTDALAENVDLAETFAQIGGTSFDADGHSLLPLLDGANPSAWRGAVLIEHHGPDLNGADPDFQESPSGNPRTYEALRTSTFVYVEYNDGETEFYDLRSDPLELHNLGRSLSLQQRIALHAELVAMKRCQGPLACWLPTAFSRPLVTRHGRHR